MPEKSDSKYIVELIESHAIKSTWYGFSAQYLLYLSSPAFNPMFTTFSYIWIFFLLGFILLKNAFVFPPQPHASVTSLKVPWAVRLPSFMKSFLENCSLNVLLEATKIRGNNVTGYFIPLTPIQVNLTPCQALAHTFPFPKVVLCLVSCNRSETLQGNRFLFSSFSIPIRAGEIQQMFLFCLFCCLFKISVSMTRKPKLEGFLIHSISLPTQRQLLLIISFLFLWWAYLHN